MQDRLTGMELGADDYICKTYHLIELVIRIKKLLEKLNNGNQVETTVVKINIFSFDKNYHCFFDEKGNEIKLTPGEYMIMTGLLEGRGRVISRNRLLDAAFQQTEYSSDRTIDVLVSVLREKFQKSHGGP